MKSLFEHLYNNYKSYPVITEMRVAGYCGKNDISARNIDEFRPNVLFSHFFNENGKENEIAFVNKISPHSLLDCMLMSMEKESISVTRLNDKTVKYIFETAYEFIEFVSNEYIMNKFGLDDGYLHICYNYDPYTLDRESGMSEKRFHLHMNYWRKKELVFNRIESLGNIKDFELMKRMVDPITIIGEYILYDLLKDQEIEIDAEVMKPDISRDLEIGLPVGLKIKIKNCQVLKDDNFSKFICKLHVLLNETYSEFEKIFCIQINRREKWKRNKLKEKKQIKEEIGHLEWLSDYGRELLEFLAENLRNIDESHINNFKNNKEMRIGHLCMNGLNYAIALFSPTSNSKGNQLVMHDKYYLVVQPKMFSDIGGAGLPCIGGVAAVKLQRNAMEFSNSEEQIRHDFHMEFLKVLQSKL